MASETASLPLVSTYLPPRGSQLRFVFAMTGWIMFRTPKVWPVWAVLAVLAIGGTIYGLARNDPWWWINLTPLPAAFVGLYIAGFLYGLRIAVRNGLYRDGRQWRLTLERQRFLVLVGEKLLVVPLDELTKVQTGFGLVMLTMLSVVPVALPRQAVSRGILECLRARTGTVSAIPTN